MMTRKEKMLWILYGIVLLLLFLLSSTDLIIKEKKTQVYKISVIIEDISDENYVNFRKGMDRAAIELHADVSLITLYDKGSGEQQRELMLREQQDGCKALIVAPADKEQILSMQEDKRMNVPLVLLNSEVSSGGDKIVERIGFDYYQMGQELGKRITEEQSPDKTVYLFRKQEPDSVSVRFQEGLLSELKPWGYEIIIQESSREGDLREAAEQIAGRNKDQAVIVALDPASLTEAAQTYSEAGEALKLKGLYGRGNTVRLLNYLDKGVIRGLCITDDFSAGYLSVKMAVELAENRMAEEVGNLESRCIRREDLRNVEYEKMLFPIE